MFVMFCFMSEKQRIQNAQLNLLQCHNVMPGWVNIVSVKLYLTPLHRLHSCRLRFRKDRHLGVHTDQKCIWEGENVHQPNFCNHQVLDYWPISKDMMNMSSSRFIWKNADVKRVQILIQEYSGFAVLWWCYFLYFLPFHLFCWLSSLVYSYFLAWHCCTPHVICPLDT